MKTKTEREEEGRRGKKREEEGRRGKKREEEGRRGKKRILMFTLKQAYVRLEYKARVQSKSTIRSALFLAKH